MNRKLKLATAACVVVLLGITAQAQQPNKSPSPTGAAVYIVSPATGAVVPSTFNVVFGLVGMGVTPAGIERQNSGHHHLLVDGAVMPNLNTPLGSAVTHFGGGQTETRLTLSPGTHTLQLILGDYLHVPHEPPVVSAVVTIRVTN